MTQPHDPNSGLPNYGGYGYGQYSGQGYEQGYSASGAYGYPPLQKQSESGCPLVIPGGPLPIGQSISFGFKRLFSKKWHVYVGTSILQGLLSLLLLLVCAAVFAEPIDRYQNGEDLSPKDLFLVLPPGLFMLLVWAAMFAVQSKLALRDTRGEQPSWGRVFNNGPWGAAILAAFLAFLIPVGLSTVLTWLGDSLDQLKPGLGQVVSLIDNIVGILVSPLFALVPFYALDGRTDALGAFKAAWDDIKPHFWRLVLTVLIYSFVTLAGVVLTLGLGLLVFVPYSCIVLAFVYRWISAHRDTPQQAAQYQQYPDAQGGYTSMY